MSRYLFSPYALLAALAALVLFLQFQLWFGNGGVRDIHRLTQVIAANETKNALLASSNHVLQANIDDLKHGQDATEEQARTELGMVKPGEIYYQIIGGKS
jgi:cell division protein FtsB